MPNKPICALIDSDIILYQDGSVLSKGGTVSIGGHTVNVPQSVDAVKKKLKERIQGILEATGCTEYLLFVSYGKNFRFDRATIQPYKGNRKDFVKPYHHKTIREVFELDYPDKLVSCWDFEADDYLAVFQDSTDTVICSRDKDLRMVEGWHYSWEAGKQNPEKPLYWIDGIVGMRHFYTQLLTGDSTDNIIGCGKKLPMKSNPTKLRRQGVGKGKAETLLANAETEEEMFQIVRAQYQAVWGTECDDAMKENGTLLYMCHDFTPWEDRENTKRLFNEYT